MPKEKETLESIIDNSWPEELGENCEVGRKLRAFYASIQDEVVPDKFLCLLEQLDLAELNAKTIETERDGGG